MARVGSTWSFLRLDDEESMTIIPFIVTVGCALLSSYLSGGDYY
jgi:hypothetical protein